MFEVSVVGDFSSAHRLMGYQGRCEDLHGHNWQVRITVAVKKLDDTGLAMDFKILKKRLNAVLENLDHKYLNDLTYFKKARPVKKRTRHKSKFSNGVNPTSENIAEYIYKKLKAQFKMRNSRLKEVTVWESENSCATFFERR